MDTDFPALREAIANDVENVTLRVHLCDLLIEHGRFDEALPICERLEPSVEKDQDLDDFDTRMEVASFFFGFGGAKGSFFGDLKAHGREAFDFYTDRKVVISRW